MCCLWSWLFRFCQITRKWTQLTCREQRAITVTWKFPIAQQKPWVSYDERAKCLISNGSNHIHANVYSLLHTHIFTHTGTQVSRANIYTKVSPLGENLWTFSSLSFPSCSHSWTQANRTSYTLSRHTPTWFSARGCINMNQGWQWRAE